MLDLYTRNNNIRTSSFNVTKNNDVFSKFYGLIHM